MRGLVLIGYRGCGKTTIGRRAAVVLGWPFIDLDAAWEQRFGVTIRAFFASHGEAAFRARETDVLRSALAEPGPRVLASGGGVVVHADNRTALSAWGGPVIYLDTPVEVLRSRLARDGGARPSLTGAPVADEVATLVAQRDPLYRACATAVIAADQPLEALVQAVVTCARQPGSTSVEKPDDNSSTPTTPHA